jgi:N-acetylneuraminic acid mutarotase
VTGILFVIRRAGNTEGSVSPAAAPRFVSLSFPFEIVYHRRCNRKATVRSRLTFFFIAIAILLGPGQTARPFPRKTLTFAKRVAYQYAIEEVYWRHRIWPRKGGENPRPKPVLDEIISRAQIEKKVEDYLRNSQLLADQWRRPITPDQLQTEMDRMASHTKQPDVLRELFASLNNDPFVIAECLARPVLAERMLATVASVKESRVAKPETEVPMTMAPISSANYTFPVIASPSGGCTDGTWTPTSTNAPAGRIYHTVVWTGSEMIVWGGHNGSLPVPDLNTGGRYNPSTDSWTATSTTNAPSARESHTAVWTGSEMIVWGGGDGTNYLNTGGKYNPSTNSWTTTSTNNAPAARVAHTAVWTGSEMIVWGGVGSGPVGLNTGGRYNPGTDSWTATSTTGTPSARANHTAVWTGSEMIVWGGTHDSSGGRYHPSTNSWTATNLTNAPVERFNHTAVWTGTEMIVWGGESDACSCFLNTGGRYNPNTDSWTATTTTNAPTRRDVHSAVWTGSEMIVWAGFEVETDSYVKTGGRYNPSTDSWTATSTTGAPDGRGSHTAVWTGSQIIVWGGENFIRPMNSGGRYCAQPSAPVVQSAASRKIHGGAGAFDVNLPLSGTPGIECRSGGATNDCTMVITFFANVSVNGSPQAAVTVGTGTVGSGGVSNGGVVTISGSVVTIPLTNVVNAQTINVTLNSVNGSTNITIPMSILLGDTNANRTVNAADVAQTKFRLGQTVDATNFRSDVNANGSINAADTAIVKQNSGTSLPPN